MKTFVHNSTAGTLRFNEYDLQHKLEGDFGSAVSNLRRQGRIEGQLQATTGGHLIDTYKDNEEVPGADKQKPNRLRDFWLYTALREVQADPTKYEET